VRARGKHGAASQNGLFGSPVWLTCR